eukprot:15338270-Ditylum_brightwellii.AAC.1
MASFVSRRTPESIVSSIFASIAPWISSWRDLLVSSAESIPMKIVNLLDTIEQEFGSSGSASQDTASSKQRVKIE